MKRKSSELGSQEDKTEKQRRQEANKDLRKIKNKKLILDQIDCYKSLFGIEIREERKEAIQEETNKILNSIEGLETKKSNYVKGLFAKYQDPEKKLLITEKIESFVKKVKESGNDTFLASANHTLNNKPFNFICLIESIPAGIKISKDHAKSLFKICRDRGSFESFNEDSPGIIQELLKNESLFIVFCSLYNQKGMISRKDFDYSLYSKNEMGSSTSSKLKPFTEDQILNEKPQAEEASRISSTSNSKTQESIFDNNQVNEASSSSNQTNQFNFGSTEKSPLISSSSNKTKELVGDSSKTSSGSESRNPSTSPKKAETILDPFEKIFDRLSGGRKSGGRKT